MSRGKGKSAVAAAAYRSGEKLTNEWDGMTHDYTRKGGVVHTEIMLPPHAPLSFSDRSTLWNSVELYEKAGNAQLAREIDAALPIELSREEQIRLVREYCSSQFVSRGMCVDYAIHDTDKGNPHCHIMLTMRPLDERGAWAAKSKKEYDLDENGERIRLPSGRYKTHKVDLTGWNDKDNTLLWRKAWADFTNDFLERNGSPERIDHRSNAERGIDEIPTVHMGVAACQMEKKGIATEKGELNRSIQKTNRLIREIRAQIGKLKEWIADLFKAWETAPKQPPQSPNLANLLMKYLSVQREKSRKYSQRWQQQHTADELKTIAAAVNYLSEHGISNLDELDASLSSVSDKAYSIREGMKTAEQRMKELQKLMEYPIQGQSTELNDNRISLYVAQRGKCAICKEPLLLGEMEVHHITPKTSGGKDNYSNLTLVTGDVHKLVHATDPVIICKYLEKLKHCKLNMAKLNKFRLLAGNCKLEYR